MLATASRIQLRSTSGSSPAARARAAAPVTAARLSGACPQLAAPARTARRADRRSLRVSATAEAPVKLTGDDLKEANRKEMRTVSGRARRGRPGGGGVRGSLAARARA